MCSAATFDGFLGPPTLSRADVGVALIPILPRVVTLISLLQRTPSFVRLYRDYSLADICFCGLLTVATALISFRPGARATVCEEVSGQPELLRDLAEAGLNVENCEQWFEHAVVAIVGVAVILLVIRVRIISLLFPTSPVLILFFSVTIHPHCLHILQKS